MPLSLSASAFPIHSIPDSPLSSRLHLVRTPSLPDSFFPSSFLSDTDKH